MAQHFEDDGRLVPQDTNFDNADQPGIAQPYSQTEIEDLLYATDLPVAERIERLKEMRAEAAARESGDWGEEDPAAMIDELDRAIEELQGDSENADDNFELDAATIVDPNDHLDALSPDDVDARAALTGQEGEADENFDAELEDDEQAENLGLR
jgi:hypothetical protein